MIAQHYYEDISLGQRESNTRLVSAELVEAFAEISGDTNPLHLDDAYAATSRFGERIAHGALITSFISALLGTRLPGLGTVFVSQTAKFIAPVALGATVTTEIEVAEKIPQKNRILFTTRCLVADKVVVVGEAIVYVPSRKA